MPIEFCFIPHDEDQYREFDHNLIEPGNGIWFENYASGQREVVGLISESYDSHGYMVFPDLAPETDLDSLKTDMTLGELPEFTGTICFDEQSPPYDIDFDDGDGAKGTLRARYVGAHAITCTNLIPSALLNPN